MHIGWIMILLQQSINFLRKYAVSREMIAKFYVSTEWGGRILIILAEGKS